MENNMTNVNQKNEIKFQSQTKTSIKQKIDLIVNGTVDHQKMSIEGMVDIYNAFKNKLIPTTPAQESNTPLISYFKTPPGKKLKKKLQVGTQRAQPRLDLPNDFYYTMKTIEDSFENPLDKLTAQFMNMSGHRKEETSRLLIENFLPKKGIVAGSSSYGT